VRWRLRPPDAPLERLRRPRFVTASVPIATPVYCQVPPLTHPVLPISALTDTSPPADTVRAYAASVAILKSAVVERDASLEGCAAPAAASPSGYRKIRRRLRPSLRRRRQKIEMKILNDILTGKDNLTFDAARVVGVFGAFAYILSLCVQVYRQRQCSPADADAYGKGLGTVLLAMAGAVMIKKSTEPEAEVREPERGDR
jgi:hypothetical protein